MSSKILHFAFEYLDRGWSVIPVNGKTPAVPWTAYQQERPSVEQVKKWFDGNEGINLAAVTGRTSGLVVIDCDTAEDGAWWREHHAETPLVAMTGRGGSHFYYRYPTSKVRNRVGIFGRKIDVRGEGGLVVAPPSIHPETSRAYQWEPWDHYAIDEIPVVDPTWLRPIGSDPLSATCSKRFGPRVRNGLSYIKQIRAESGNGGHNATFRAACTLRDSGLSADEALDALSTWNETNAVPPWSGEELAHKIHDAYRGLS